MSASKKEYAVYKGDDLLVMGTSKECGEELGVTAKYIEWLTSPTGKRRYANRKNPERCVTAIRLEDDDE